jgi:hypothetical protein
MLAKVKQNQEKEWLTIVSGAGEVGARESY